MLQRAFAQKQKIVLMSFFLCVLFSCQTLYTVPLPLTAMVWYNLSPRKGPIIPDYTFYQEAASTSELYN